MAMEYQTIESMLGVAALENLLKTEGARGRFHLLACLESFANANRLSCLMACRAHHHSTPPAEALKLADLRIGHVRFSRYISGWRGFGR